jgi:conjugative relaxase-like TrwC/TraI family protein
MLSPKAQYSVGDAKKYFREHLGVGDYYTEGQHAPGQWFGQGAEDLGLSGVTTEDQFVRLCDNLNPQTGERLTLRLKTTRTEKGTDGEEREAANRRVFYDFTLSPPKSVSIAALVADDTRIVEAHEHAVTEALRQLQTFAATRVRKNGQCADRTTGNLVAAVFRHDTSRALDPHLHSHAIVFNATFDAVEQQWKALQNHDMLVAQKFVENVYYHELARKLVKFGYQIENKPRGDFEIKGVRPELIEKFSKRHRQIDEKTREVLAREPEKAGGNIAAIRENIAHRKRPPKVRDMGLAKLQRQWDGQMTAADRESLNQLATGQPPVIKPVAGMAEKAVIWAEEHLFERRSVVQEHELWRHALEYARGQSVSLPELQSATRGRGYLRYDDHPGEITTREHLERELEIVDLVRRGICECAPMVVGHTPSSRLDAEQQQAVSSILLSSNFATLFRGGAGTGKSFTLREVQRALLEVGHTVRVIAPQRQQVMGLEKDGLQNVETVSAFLARREMPQRAIVLVDEAGQIGGKQMHALLRLVQASEGRVILSGDTRQHGAVEASDALRAIEKYSGARPIELNTIRRQNPALAKTIEERKRIKEYRQAVAEAQAGKFTESFDRLEKQGAITQCTPADLHQKLTERYLELVKDNQSTVVVSQTWSEVHQVNEQIRLALIDAKLVGEAEKAVMTFQPVDLTDAQKRDQRSYEAGRVLVFNRDVRGFKAGESARLRAITETHLIVESDNRIAPIAFKHLDKVTVCQSKEMPLAAGDRLQLKANGRSENNRKLANGELVAVREVQSDGRIALADGRVLPPQFRQFVRGYAVTSYASQGKSVNHVLFSDSSAKPATNQQQWYVTISRGRKGINIFTTDKRQLREQITNEGHRPSAIDMVAYWHKHDPFFRQMERRWGRRIAAIMTMLEQSRRVEALRQRKLQRIQQTQIGSAPKQSRGVGI